MRPGWKLAGIDIKRANRAACVLALREERTSSIAEVAAATGLSRVTVEPILDDLVKGGLVRNEGVSQSPGGGRPARRFGFDASFGAVVGIDVGPHRSRVVATDLSGDVVAYRSSDPEQGSLRPDDLVGFVAEALSGSGIDRVRAAAVSFSGLVSHDGRVLVSDSLGDWVGYDIASDLARQLSCPVVVDNDTRLATSGEHRAGVARGCESVVYLYAGHRFSVGSVVNGRVLRGSNYAAGEVGGLLFPPERANAEWRSAPTAKAALELAASGDREARAEVQEFVEAAARGLAAVIMVVDPEIVVVGGGLSRAGEAFLAPVRSAVADLIHVPVSHVMVTSPLGADAPLIGALALAYDIASESIFGMPDVPLPEFSLAGSADGEGILA